MKKVILTIALVIMLVATLVVLTGCVNNSSKPIVGSWEYGSGSGYIYKFNEDGTGSYTFGGAERAFTYEDDGTKVKILYNGDTAASTYEYRIEDKKLIIKDSLGSDVEYNKK